ncbi:hypothetical protein C6W88_00525 [Halomonas litopenaei]|uniref:Flp family type IVb pilin n=1 Tax=Halomonas litopenaei TaxID=2109328 RepID=A0ABX5J1T2_9GAMM|nr:MULTISPECIES: Flp family type IVb pilin [Halomonas]MBS8270164.1 Flp family type IVb pilin [Halomonas litopenaei]PTL93161.1 hypothetical protein C6W89_04625 [Halomonas sp. SYSU XM8]PTL95935.1 hypothetical protein C6W88_00525 [Halomonas litopenaei]RQW69428.1 Flp family type IVb pilin [Halomonas sp. YLB-10]
MKVFQRFSRGEAAPVRKISSLNHPRYRGQRGASAIEYAVIIALIAVALVAAFSSGGIPEALNTFVENISNTINPPTTEDP